MAIGPDRRRVGRMFGLARILSFIPITVIVLGIAVSYSMGGFLRSGTLIFPSEVSVWLWLLAILFVLAALAVRSFFLRIVLDDNNIRVTQWFWTTKIPMNEVAAIYPASYIGVLNGGGLGDLGLGDLIPVIELGCIRRGEWITIDLPATLSPFWLVDRKLQRLRSAVEAQSGQAISEWPYDSPDGPGLTLNH